MPDPAALDARAVPDPAALDARAVRRARVGLTALFVVLGVGSGSLASRLPAIKTHLHLSAGGLGLALLGTAVGSVLSTPVTGTVLARVAPRRWIAVGLVPFAAFLPLVTLATGRWSLLGVLAGFGFGMGCVDVAMNTEATRVQDLAGRRIMSGIHATFSVGSLAGAGLGAALAAAAVGFEVQFVVFAVVAVVAGGAAVAQLPDLPATTAAPGPAPAPPSRALPALQWGLVALAFICFSYMLSEGAADDWIAVYLHGSLGASSAVGALGFAAFSATMVIGRFGGDRVTNRWGPVRVVRVAAVVGAAGLTAGLVGGNPIVGIVGFACLGVGLAVGVPLAISAAAALGTAGPSVALVTSCGYLGFLSGPPLIGGLATVVSLRVALALVVALCVGLALLAGRLRGPAPAVAPAPAPAVGAPTR